MRLLFFLLSTLFFLNGAVEATEGYRFQKIEHLDETLDESLKEAYDQAICRLEIEESLKASFEELRLGLCFGKVAALFWLMEQKGCSPNEAIQEISLEEVVYWQLRQNINGPLSISTEQPEIAVRKRHNPLLPWKERCTWLSSLNEEHSYFEGFAWFNLFWTLDEYSNNILGRISIPPIGSCAMSHTFSFWRWDGLYGLYDQQSLFEFDDKDCFLKFLISNVNYYYNEYAKESDRNKLIRVNFEELPPSLR